MLANLCSDSELHKKLIKGIWPRSWVGQRCHNGLLPQLCFENLVLHLHFLGFVEHYTLLNIICICLRKLTQVS